VETIVFLLVALVSLKTTHGLLGTFDLGLDDETVYLDGARWLGVHHLPIAESSPLYPMWYRLLSFVEPDRLRLYFLNWYVLTASLPVVLYALARRSGAPLAAAAAISVAWSVSATGLTWPFVTKFAALVLAVGALAATYARDPRTAAAISSITLSMASYARPELSMFAFALGGIVALWGIASVIARRNSSWHARRPGAVAALLAVTTAALLRLRFGDTGTGNRAYFAFGQHYALNVIEDKQLPIDPWTNWYGIAKEAFPTASTVVGAAKENPNAFQWHITRNLATLPTTVVELFRPLFYVPVPLRQLTIHAFDLALVLGIVGLLFFRARRFSHIHRWLPLLAIVGASTLASSLIVYPRQHYVLPFCFLSIAALASCAGRIRDALAPITCVRRWQLGLHALLVAALAAFLVAVPSALPGALPSLLPVRAAVVGIQENVLTIETLRRLRLTGRIVILESDHSRAVYTDYEYVRVAQWEKSSGFWDFVHARGINVIVLNDRLRTDTRFMHDPEFEAFVERRGPLEDFVDIPIAGTRAVLMVRRTLLPGH